jgi:hypothetical protein
MVCSFSPFNILWRQNKVETIIIIIIIIIIISLLSIDFWLFKSTASTCKLLFHFTLGTYKCHEVFLSRQGGILEY